MALGGEVEAGVEVDAGFEAAEVEVDAGFEAVEAEIELVGRLSLLPPSSRLLPPCRASVTILAASFLYSGGVASR